MFKDPEGIPVMTWHKRAPAGVELGAVWIGEGLITGAAVAVELGGVAVCNPWNGLQLVKTISKPSPAISHRSKLNNRLSVRVLITV
jgi:hypothetical protein